MKKLKVDIPFLVSIFILAIAGYFIFTSASFGLLTKQASRYSGVVFNQTVFGLIFGTLACIATSFIDYKNYRKYSLYLYILAIIVTVLVFVPGIGVTIGGAARWIYIGKLSFQPSEFLKIGFIIYFSAWLSGMRDKADTFKYGFLPFLILTAINGAILLSQPDTDTFFITVIAALSIFLVGGGRWKYVFILIICGILGLGIIAYTKPHVMNRITTFINPGANSLGSGYQIQQSLIAVGSGGVFGRGFGQSIQKFNVLPEPIGDSIFAVTSEEFGFTGATAIVLLFIFFGFRGLKIASNAPDSFGRLMATGIVIMIVSQAFVNIGAMVGVLPLSGITLPFISHGGTALFMTLAEVGILLNISKNKKKA